MTVVVKFQGDGVRRLRRALVALSQRGETTLPRGLIDTGRRTRTQVKLALAEQASISKRPIDAGVRGCSYGPPTPTRSSAVARASR